MNTDEESAFEPTEPIERIPNKPPKEEDPDVLGELDPDTLLAVEVETKEEASVDSIFPDVASLTRAIDRLSQQISADQDLISRMQSRIEILQSDQVRALLAPAVTELANLHAEFAESSGRDYERLGIDRVRREFTILSDHVETAIDLLGAVSLDVQVGDLFDPRVHQAVKNVPTGDAALDRKVAAVLRQGFTFDPAGKPVLYARVRVYSYDSLLEPASLTPKPTTEPIAPSTPVLPPGTTDAAGSSPPAAPIPDNFELPFSR